LPGSMKTGTILIAEGTLLPEGLRFESEPCVPGWSFVKNLDAADLGRRIQEAGWTFFYMAGEINLTVCGFDEQKTVRRAVEHILANLKPEKFNSLQITRVASVASQRFLGVSYLTVTAHSRHIQESMISVPGMDSGIGDSAQMPYSQAAPAGARPARNAAGEK
jgi:hypothetical protein